MKNRILMLFLTFASELVASIVMTSPCVSRRYNSDSVVCVCNSTYCDIMPPTTPPGQGRFTTYTSSRDSLRFQRLEHNFSFSLTNEDVSVSFSLDATTTHQQIIGFGGAFTDAAGINIKSLSAVTQDRLLCSYFHEDGLEYNVGRVPIGGCDFSTRKYTYDDIVGDVTLEHFSLQPEDKDYKIPLIQRAIELSTRPIKMFGSAWSAPAWMKTNNKLTGRGQLKPEYRQLWAEYFIRFLQAYDANNISFWGLTAQNEPMDGLVPFFPFNCMGWTAESQRDWIRDHLGPTLAASSYNSTLLMILDDNRISLPGWAQTILDDPDAAQYVAGTAVHWYMDWFISAEFLTRTHDQFPDHFILSTEACSGSLAWDLTKVLLGSWQRAEDYAHDIIENLNNWVGGWVDWNLALDLQGGPNWERNFVDSPIIVNKTADEFYKQPMFYALGHFSKFLTPGSTHVTLIPSCNASGIESTSFVTPEGSTIVNLLNTKHQTTLVSIDVSDQGHAVASLPAKSITTFQWKH